MAGEEDVPESPGDMAFSFFDRQERVFKRLEEKIGRLDRRLTTIEERRRTR
jgi:hypothetical protein